MTDNDIAPGQEPETPDGRTLDALEAALEALDARRPGEVPQWEFCEGVMTAMLCMRRVVPAEEWLPMLFDAHQDDIFASPAERTHFLMHWMEREAQLRAALRAPVEALEDEGALEPGVLDWRGLAATISQEEREQAFGGDKPPPFAQAWAGGFLGAVDYWAQDWMLPRDKTIAADMRRAIDALRALLQEDRALPAVNLYDEAGEPSVSDARLEAFGEAIWAVYDLYDIALSLGPRTLPAVSEKIGRNDPCPCGSGKKYKKCCGA